MDTPIPGLMFSGDNSEKLLAFTTFGGKKVVERIPASHIYGNTRRSMDFEKLSKIAAGKFGIFYKVKEKKTKEIYTLKKFVFPEDIQKNGAPIDMLREINLLRILKHDNIVNSHGAVAGKDLENANFLLLDYCVISLKEMIEKDASIFEKGVIKNMVKQLFQGVNYIHEATVVHGNISTGNILFTECGTLKIGGSRTVAFYAKEGLSSSTNTEARFRAPELLFKAKYGYPADIWSAACVFAELLLKKPLFIGESEKEVMSSIFNVIGTPSETLWPGFDRILQKGTRYEKEIKDPLPYSDLKNVLASVPHACTELLNDIFIYYPNVRIVASDVLKSPYMLNVMNPACSSEKMKQIVKEAVAKTIMSIADD